MGASPTEENPMTDFRIGVDIGGTFTDIVFLGGDGQVLTRKVASTPDDYSRAVLNGIRAGYGRAGNRTRRGHRGGPRLHCRHQCHH